MVTQVKPEILEVESLKIKRAVVLLSGGIDSTVTAYIARQDTGRSGQLFGLTFEYGQRHVKETFYAEDIGILLHFRYHVVEYIPIVNLVNSSLVGRGEILTEIEKGIPSTWVPQRNSIFLALAFAYAETIGADRVYIGVNSRDYSGYPDCRPEFIEIMNKALNLASKRFVETGKGIGIITPLQYFSKVDIIRKGIELGVDFSKTWSCYRGEELACGRCPSCLIRLKAFEELGMEDPVEYENS